MTLKHWLPVLGLVALVAVSPVNPGQAEDAAKFYEGRTISLITGWGPGGGYDIQLRLTAPYLQKYTGSTVVVRNMPGASGLKAINYLAKAANQKGLDIAFLKLSVLLPAQLITPKEIRFDLAKMNAIAGTRAYYAFLALRSDLPYKSINELISSGREVRVAGIDRRSELNWAPLMILKPLGVKIASVLGYTGSGEMLLAVQRREADANFLPFNNVGPYIKEGKLRALAIFSPRRSSELPDVPTIYEAVNLPEDVKHWVDFYAGLNTYAGCILAPPGVPKDRVEYLRRAFEKVMENKELLDKLNSANLDPLYTSGEEMEQFIKNALNMKPERLKEWKSVIGVK